MIPEEPPPPRPPINNWTRPSYPLWGRRNWTSEAPPHPSWGNRNSDPRTET